MAGKEENELSLSAEDKKVLVDAINENKNSTEELDSKEVEVEAENKTAEVEAKEESKVEKPTSSDSNYKEQYEALLKKFSIAVDESAKWKEFSRKWENSYKSSQKDIEIEGILSKHGLPAEAKQFLITDDAESLESSAQSLKSMFSQSSEKKEESKFVIKNPLQGINDGEKIAADPLAEAFAQAMKNAK